MVSPLLVQMLMAVVRVKKKMVLVRRWWWCTRSGRGSENDGRNIMEVLASYQRTTADGKREMVLPRRKTERDSRSLHRLSWHTKGRAHEDG